MNKVRNRNVIWLLLTIFIVIIGIHLYRFKMLKETNKTFAVFVEYNIGGGNTQKFFTFQTASNEKIKAAVTFTEKLEIGDTVWIEYSLSYPKVIKVIDKDYKKYMTEVNRYKKRL